MSIKNIYLVIIILTSCVTFSQEKNSENMKIVENFSKDLFDENVSPKDIILSYMAFEGDEVEKSKSFTERFIQIVRDSVGKDLGWLFPGTKVKNLKKNIKVEPYLLTEKTKLKLNHSKEVLKNAYVLINSDTNEIVQYFNVKEGKIYSFNLFGKGDRYWFFGF